MTKGTRSTYNCIILLKKERRALRREQGQSLLLSLNVLPRCDALDVIKTTIKCLFRPSISYFIVNA